MSKIFKHVVSFASIIVFIYIGIASTSSKKTTSQAEKIPPTFKGYTGTILILKSTNDWMRTAKKYFGEYYKGDYIFINRDELDKYDANKYRFFIYREENIRTLGNQTSYDEKVCTLDRVTGLRYCAESKIGNYSVLLHDYAKALETARNQ